MEGDDLMPFESKYTKEEIIHAAFQIAEKEGFAAISARTVAKRIKGSVAPIYFNFKNIDELIEAVVLKVFSITDDIFKKQSSKSLYENMGRAGFEFAEKYPVFFRELVLKPNPYLASYEKQEEAMIRGLDLDEQGSKLSFEQRKQLILKVKALQIGFQTMIANDQLPSWISKKATQDLFISLGHQLMELEINNNYTRRKK
jgi:AcrR family transcriptional regulator